MSCGNFQKSIKYRIAWLLNGRLPLRRLKTTWKTFNQLPKESSSHIINSWGLNIFFVCSLLKYLPKVKAKPQVASQFFQRQTIQQYCRHFFTSKQSPLWAIRFQKRVCKGYRRFFIKPLLGTCHLHERRKTITACLESNHI